MNTEHGSVLNLALSAKREQKKIYKPTAFDNPLVKLFSTFEPPIKTSKTFL